MSGITDEQVAELRRLESEATPGPWRTSWDDDSPELCERGAEVVIAGPGNPHEEGFVAGNVYYDGPHFGCEARNARLIAAMRNALPALLDEVERLTRERDEALHLAYIGNHHFPDLTWKARAEEALADLSAAKAEVERLRRVVDAATSVAFEMYFGTDNGTGLVTAGERLRLALDALDAAEVARPAVERLNPSGQSWQCDGCWTWFKDEPANTNSDDGGGMAAWYCKACTQSNAGGGKP